jgi:hypothetical protein
MAWFSIRSVYLFGRKADGANVFEERIVSFKAESADDALNKAAVESERYASAHKMEAFPEREAYEQDGDPLIDGYEVWSVLFESRETLAEFYDRHYKRDDYQA